MYILGEIYIYVVIKNNILAYSMYSMLYLNVKIAHNALEQNIIRHLFVQFIVSAKYIQCIYHVYAQ